ncbi:MAG: mandelate racemase/muconate lactonizing enzyme family protein [Candidatus Rokubacteria bacterium]|nr:mandelate racemase/muconate lactonizing enzyme family protein [Candidatus Rokubacteria bacterium]MBI4593237.1 mandelate racemase/muconate lactonizing enzyme family protein [Candidatus Rokubacteria bacterium]
MKIREVRSYVLKHPLPEAEVFGSSKSWYTARQALVIEIVTDEGLSGFGEAYGPPPVNRTLVDEMYGPRIVGRDPLEPAVIWEDLYGFYRDYGRKGWAVAAISAIDIALWDLKGKALGQPIATLLGGAFRTRFRAYATALYRRRVADNAAALAREAEGYAAEGFRAMKMKVGFGLDEDVRNVRAVRAAIGPDRLLAMDANHGYDAGTAIRFARKVEAQDLAWFEEPVVPEDLDGYCQIKAAVRMPIAGGEAEFSRWGFRDLCARRAVDIVQPDVCGCGGFTEAWRIAALASAAGLTVYPHVWGTAVALFASLHLAAALPPNPPAMVPSEPLFELDRTPNPLRDQLALNPPKRAGDEIELPTGPGLGLEIDRKALERYRV